jgi:5-methylthioadenosine/S-adenosylhomocysteine deaminase
VVTNPVSNLKLAVGRVFPYRRARELGIPVGIGTDGAASNNSLDLLQDVKVLALLQKHAQDDPTAVPADEAWALATGRLAPALAPSSRIAVGEPDTVIFAGRVLMLRRAIEGIDEVLAKATEAARALRGR